MTRCTDGGSSKAWRSARYAGNPAARSSTLSTTGDVAGAFNTRSVRRAEQRVRLPFIQTASQPDQDEDSHDADPNTEVRHDET